VAEYNICLIVIYVVKVDIYDVMLLHCDDIIECISVIAAPFQSSNPVTTLHVVMYVLCMNEVLTDTFIQCFAVFLSSLSSYSFSAAYSAVVYFNNYLVN